MTQTATKRLPVEDALIAAFDTVKDGLSGQDWLAPARAEAIAAFAERGMPHRRVEEYRYFDLRRLLGRAGTLTPAAEWREAVMFADEGARAFANLGRYVMVFANGRFRPDLSALAGLPEGVEVTSFAEAADANVAWVKDGVGEKAADDPVAAINHAFAADGAAIRVREGVTLDKPIELVWFSGGDAEAFHHAKSVIVLEKGASLTLLEARGDAAESPMLSTESAHVSVGEGAQLTHARIMADREGAVRLGRSHVHLAADATYNALGLAVGAGHARADARVEFEGEGAHAAVNGVTLLGGNAIMDNTLFVDHAVPNCTSEETFRAVLDDHARAVFQGSILVREHAQKTDAQMQARALLLSRKAEMDAKPMLEIYADDVQCAHGSAIGEPDADAIFYLMSRGIDEKTARALLVAGFLDDVVDGFDDGDIGHALKSLLADRLGAPIEEDAA